MARKLWLVLAVAAAAQAAPAQASTCHWQGAFGVDWRASTANWSCGEIPDAGDDVILAGGDNVGVATQDEAAASVSMTAGARITTSAGRTLNVAGSFTAASGILSGGTVRVAGTFLKTTALTALNIQNGALLALDGPGSIDGGHICVAVGGSGGGSMDVNDTFELLLGANPVPLQNCGNTGVIRVNPPDGRLLLNHDESMTVSQAVDNDDAVDVLDGSLVLTGNSSGNQQAGAYSVAAGSGLFFNAGFNEIHGSVTGAGVVGIAGGTLSFATGAAYQVTNTQLISGTFALAGSGTATTDEFQMEGGVRAGTRTLSAGHFAAKTGVLEGAGTTAAAVFHKTTASALFVEGSAKLSVAGASSITGGHICVARSGQGSGFMEVSGTFSILPGADGHPLRDCGNSGTITVLPGAALKKDTPGTTLINQALANAGTVEVAQGTLEVGDGSGVSQPGAWTGAAGTALRFVAGNNVIGGSVSGFSTVGVSGGVQTFADGGTYDIAATELTGGTLSFAGTGTAVTGSLLLEGGVRAGVRTFTAGTMDARNGRLENGTTAVTGAFTKTTAGAVDLRQSGVLALGGTSSISGGHLCLGVSGAGGGSMTSAGTLTIAESADPHPLRNCGNSGSLTLSAPDGRLRKEQSGSTSISQAVVNHGTVEITQGTLQLSGGTGVSQTGVWTGVAGAALRFSGGTNVIAGSVSGIGTLGVSGGGLTFADGGTLDVAATELTGGTLSLAGSGAATTGSLLLDGGVRGGARTLTAGSMDARGGRLENGVTSVTGAFAKTTAAELTIRLSAKLALAGASTMDGGHMCIGVAGSGGGSLDLAGPLTLLPGADAAPLRNCGNSSAVGVLAPSGALQTGGAGTWSISSPVSNAGTVATGAGQTLTFTGGYTQPGGTLVADGTVGANVTLPAGAVLRGGGTVSGNVVNAAGVVRPGGSPGLLKVTGDFTQQAAGEIEVEIEGTDRGVSYDAIDVTQAVFLGGKVEVLRPTGFNPALADVFSFLRSGSRTGTFLEPPDQAPLPDGKTFSLAYPGFPDFGAQLVLQAPPAPTAGTPAIQGAVAIGNQVTCDPGTWTGAPAFTYEWLDEGTPIAGETAATLTIPASLATRQLSCRVTGTNLGGSDAATSSSVTVPPVAPQNTNPPAISGTPAVGEVLTCVPGTWSGAPAPTLAYEWLRDGAPVGGATASTYTLVAGDGGHPVSCRETATNAGGSASATSAAVNVPVPPAPSPTPTPTPTPTPAASPSPTPTPDPPTPEQTLAAAPASEVAQAFGLPSARRCVSRRNFVIRLRAPREITIRTARVTLNGKRLKVRKAGGRHVARVDLRGFPKGRFTVRIRIVTGRGVTLNGSRTYRTCAPRNG